jgi:sugar phosphate isomerase/epimerase
MKFSVFTVCTPEYDIKETIKLLKELGYHGVEWRIGPPPPEKKPEDYSHDRRYWSYNLSTVDINKVDVLMPEIKSLCGEQGLEICSLTTALGLWEVEDAERVMKAANAIGCRNIRIWMPWYDGKENYRSIVARSIDQLKILVGLAEKYDVRINFETHMNNIIPSASSVYHMVKGFDPRYVGVIYDPGNMVYEGFESYKIGVDLLGEYLAHVHVKNAMWRLKETTEDGVDLWEPGFAALKKGSANWSKILEVLKNAGYNGYLSIEDFSNEEDTRTKLKTNIEYLKKISG